ncbi:MAG: hypothetical protein LWX83_19165, partial [Anaerolineae bacterium]|nr:hypothetical protein [Anaerolineae bacterium]
MGAAILVFILVISLMNFFPFSSWIAVLIGIGAYFTLYTSVVSISKSSLIPFGVISLVYFITALLAEFYLRQIRIFNKQVSREHALVNDLIQYDQSTGVLRWKFAHQQLTIEVLRSRRYKKNLTLVLIQPVIPPDLKM